MLSKLQQNLKSIENATSNESLKYSVEEFVAYLLKYPGVKNKVAKVSILIKSNL